MGIVVDTNVWADVDRGILRADAVAAAAGEEPVYLTPTVLAELWHGVHRATSEAQRTK